MDNFKDNLKVTPNTSRYMQQYEMVTNNEYIDFTCALFSDICSCIEKKFTGISLEHKVRIKGKNSYEKKASKDKHIYDIYGAKTVVLHVDDNCSENLCIKGYLSRRKTIEEKLQAAIANKERLELEDPNYEIRKQDLEEIISIRREQYQTANDICETKASEKIVQFIIELINDPYFKETYGLYHIESRDRDYNLENEYIAKHTTLGSTKLPLWYLEWQSKSMLSYNIARTGRASHDGRTDKSLTPPKSIDTISEDELAHYIVYKSNGQLHIAGTFENTYHKYQPIFKKYPELEDRIINSTLINKTGYDIDPRGN